MAERFRNQGYATQAVRAVVNAVALERNVASNKVIQKSGLPYVGPVDIDGELHYHYQQVR